MTQKDTDEQPISVDKAVELIATKTGNLFENHKLCCSESVLLALNEGFGGGLPPDAAVCLSSGFCGGMGDAGCTCGALSGAIMALGLFLGPGRKDGVGKKKLRELSRITHDEFKKQFSSTCCRVLTKKVRHDKKLRRRNCMLLTVGGAESVARQVLEHRPDIRKKLNTGFLEDRQSRLRILLNKILGKSTA